MANSTHSLIAPHPLLRVSAPPSSSSFSSPSSSSSSTISISSHSEEENDNRHERLEQCDAILNSSSSEIPAEAKALAVLKAFREHLPADGLENFVDDILACANLGGMPYMQKLGDHLLTAILIPFKILSLGPPSLKHKHDLLGSVSQHANGIKHLSETTFARDGRRCVYTGNIDIHHVQDGPEPQTGPVAYTASRHILPYGLKDHTEDTPRETEAKRAIWWSVHRYFPALAGKIDGFSIDQPANVLTLNESVSSDFGECHLAFKPLPTENEYEVVVLGRISSGYPFNTGYHITKMVLSAHNALDLPDRDFLDMHHRMARMLSETDIVEEIQSRPARRDTEDPCDQSSTDVAHIFPLMLTCLSNL
ncbi:hypothetical protein CGGC5_v011053 [Colletotrichum fructicola Nara gc5]|uniref:HNH nuclease domain-containing protein n=1 Tax=Colletotrichum fructicola (strain Nara gc5) TaxID=1213859 RepID=A0A7J6IV22_COLFN|nr:hypothetical protein CFRS1_v002703 [Colletotrichum fructicola]KAF4480619.1 hypothetical protein CGGC5_v011053 [Colletotrichum fructicola Nara gc5]KAF5488550.1 hypothetical protein CGCF413_v012594 [Colletotrichum fructicola]